MVHTHPCSKEFQEEAKKLGISGNELIWKYKRDGILKTDNQVDREYIYPNIKRYWAKHKDVLNQKQRLNYYNHGGTSKDENLDCPLNFGFVLGETLFDNYLRTIFEHVEHLPLQKQDRKHVNFVVKNPNKIFLENNKQNPSLYTYGFEKDKEYKIYISNICLKFGNSWSFRIDYNHTPDYFLLAGWDDRVKLNLMKVWIFHRDEMIKIGKNVNNRKMFWNRLVFSVNNAERYLYPFLKYELQDIGDLRLLWKEMRD